MCLDPVPRCPPLQRPPKRLRHLEAVSARNLLPPPDGPAAAAPPARQLWTYFSLCLPAEPRGSSGCALLYRSEAVGHAQAQRPGWPACESLRC